MEVFMKARMIVPACVLGLSIGVDAKDTKKGSIRNPSATPPAADTAPTPQDIELTQNIRQRLMNDKSLSFSAQNVKIITLNGNVTLEGYVPSSKDRKRVEALS
jgi:osmotically-inducible protein OsmY